MRIKDFGAFVNEEKMVKASGASSKTETTLTIPKKFADLIKQASEHNDKVKALTAELKAESKTKELFDEAVKSKLKEMEQTSVRFGKILATLKSVPGRESYSYTEAIDILRKKLFEVNQAAAILCDKAVQALKHTNDAKVSVEYVKEGIVDTVKGWLSSWKALFTEKVDEYTQKVDDLEEVLKGIRQSGMYGETSEGVINEMKAMTDEELVAACEDIQFIDNTAQEAKEPKKLVAELIRRLKATWLKIDLPAGYSPK